MFDRFKLETFSSLRHRDFRYLWIGTCMMSGGQWIEQVTLNWLMYEMTNLAVLLGLLNGVRASPFLISSPIAGVAADRMDQRTGAIREDFRYSSALAQIAGNLS